LEYNHYEILFFYREGKMVSNNQILPFQQQEQEEIVYIRVYSLINHFFAFFPVWFFQVDP